MSSWIGHREHLVIDDWGLAPLKEQERRDMLEILEDRYSNRSTLMTRQLPTTKWHDHLDDPTVADAICDRLLHNSHRVVLKGPSRRKEESAEKAVTRQGRFAPSTMTDPPDHDRPIWVITMAGVRSYAWSGTFGRRPSYLSSWAYATTPSGGEVVLRGGFEGCGSGYFGGGSEVGIKRGVRVGTARGGYQVGPPGAAEAQCGA